MSASEITDTHGLQAAAILYGVMCGIFPNSPFEGDLLALLRDVCGLEQGSASTRPPKKYLSAAEFSQGIAPLEMTKRDSSLQVFGNRIATRQPSGLNLPLRLCPLRLRLFCPPSLL